MGTFKYAGLGASKGFLRDVVGMIVMDKDTAQTVANAKTLAAWKTLIAPATIAAIKGMYIPINRGIEPTTPEPEMVTANTGYMEKTKDFAPSFKAYGFVSYEDYQTWIKADTTEKQITLVLSDGMHMATPQSDGDAMGFTSRIFMKYNIPVAGGEGKTHAAQFDIVMDDFEEWKNRITYKPDFKINELKALNPMGVNIEVITAYENSGGTVVIKATHRVTGLPVAVFDATTNWEVISTSTDAGGACTVCGATNKAIGVYTLTILNSAAKMTGDFEIQAVEVDSGPNINYLSNVLNVPV